MARKCATSATTTMRFLVYAALLVTMPLAIYLTASTYVKRDGYTDRGGEVRISDDAGRGRLLYVYMHGCGWCKKFDPVWQAFVNRYGGALKKAGLTVKKMTSDDDEAKRLSIRGYPSVMFVPSVGGGQVPFDGERTVEGLASFVAANVDSFTP